MITLDGSEVYGAGAHIHKGFADAIAIARKTGQVVKLLWNGQPTRIRYSDTLDGLKSARKRKFTHSKTIRAAKKERQKRNDAIHRQARRLSRTLPHWLFAWALDKEAPYGTALSILMAADALEIAKKYGSAEAIKEAFENRTLKTVADSGASEAMTAKMAMAICEGKFPGQDSTGLITNTWRSGKETFSLWKTLGFVS